MSKLYYHCTRCGGYSLLNGARLRPNNGLKITDSLLRRCQGCQVIIIVDIGEIKVDGAYIFSTIGKLVVICLALGMAIGAALGFAGGRS